MKDNLELDLETIKQLGVENEENNFRFRSFLKGLDGKKVDIVVHRLNKEVTALIDCAKCANCCKNLPVFLQQEDIKALAEYKKMSTKIFNKKFVIFDSDDNNFRFKEIPCSFLNENKCTVYDFRPIECRSYPHLQKVDLISRLLTVISNYSTCPIVFNVYENLKKELDFK